MVEVFCSHCGLSSTATARDELWQQLDNGTLLLCHDCYKKQKHGIKGGNIMQWGRTVATCSVIVTVVTKHMDLLRGPLSEREKARAKDELELRLQRVTMFVNAIAYLSEWKSDWAPGTIIHLKNGDEFFAPIEYEAFNAHLFTGCDSDG
jgi:hypothetical protein